MISLANTQRIRRSSLVFWRCQSAFRSLNHCYSARQVQKITAAWMPRVAGLLLAQATRRGRSGTAGLALSPRAPARPVPGSFFVFIRLLRSLTATPPQPQQLRRARSCSPSQNRSLHLHRSAALFSSTSSTPWLHRLSFGKGALSVPDTAAMRVSSPELRPPWLG